jgi:LacI family transcriptional regulator
MPPKPSPTIYDVAKSAGVSIATVSRVLNASDKVNEATRQRIVDAIDELGFVPKAEARARALRAAGRIGVLTPFFTAPSFVQRLRGVSAALSDTHHELIIYTVESTEHLNGYLASLPLTGNLDGLIILSMEVDDSAVKRLNEHDLKTVLVEYPVQTLSSVVINDLGGGRMAAEHLISKGHTRIAFIGVDRSPEYAHKPIGLRLKGFQKALRQANIDLPDERVIHAPFELESTYQLALLLLQQKNPPTAIFAATDLQAMAVLKAAREIGLRIPDDLAIIGFDDLDMASYLGLTTIRQHLDESGRIAVELLLADLAAPDRLPRHVELPLDIVQRDTT